MPYTMEQFMRENQKETMENLTPEAQEKFAETLPPEIRLKGLSIREKMKGLSPEEIEAYLQQLRVESSQSESS